MPLIASHSSPARWEIPQKRDVPTTQKSVTSAHNAVGGGRKECPAPKEKEAEKSMSARSNEQLGVRTNAGVVQETYEAVGHGDIPALLDLLTDDVEWTFQGPSTIPFAGTRRGREGVAEFFALVGEILKFREFEPREFVAQGDTVVVLGFERSLVKPTGRTFEQEWAHVYTLRDGKVAAFLALEDTAAHVVAFDATT
jgi:ketosteroid isomerase-like protein